MTKAPVVIALIVIAGLLAYGTGYATGTDLTGLVIFCAPFALWAAWYGFRQGRSRL